MIEVHPGLFVGKNEDFIQLIATWEDNVPIKWAIVHACKEPYHREFVGYEGRAAPKDHPEYLCAVRGARLALNLVDTPDPEYVKTELVGAAMRFIDKARVAGDNVLIHCNQGGSRAPGLALHWLRRNDPRFLDKEDSELDFDIGEAMMRGLYPAYAPAEGIRGFLREHWNWRSAQ